MTAKVRYYSERDVLITILLWGPMILAATLAHSGPFWLRLVLVPALGLVTWTWLATWYEFTEKTLETHCGPFRESIPLESIRKATASRSLMSGAALSLKRISIIHGKFGEESLISPRERSTFVAELRARCPEASFDERLLSE